MFAPMMMVPITVMPVPGYESSCIDEAAMSARNPHELRWSDLDSDDEALDRVDADLESVVSVVDLESESDVELDLSSDASQLGDLVSESEAEVPVAARPLRRWTTGDLELEIALAAREAALDKAEALSDTTAADSDSRAGSVSEAPEEQPPTTLRLSGFARLFSRADLLQLLQAEGLVSFVDFVYLPCEFKRDCACHGYAFLNFSTGELASRAKSQLQASLPPRGLEVSWSIHQGLDTHVARLRDSPLMHPDVREAVKPLLLCRGVPMAFPEPTKLLENPLFPPRGSRFGRHKARRGKQ